jgi:hypothetical protein
MTPAKRRLLRRTVANGPYGPPDETEEFTAVSVPAPSKLQATSDGTTTLVVGTQVIFRAKDGTGTPEARDAVETLQGIVESVAAPVFTFSTIPTDLTGTDFTGLVLYVWPTV